MHVGSVPISTGDGRATAAPLVHVPTADGARLVVKRRPTPGGTPVIFLHGLAVNADLWDLPEVRGADFHYRSLASVLHEAGYDIWLVNLRGHGRPRMLSTPAPGQADWCIDHFVLFDLPAVVARVRAETGRRPFIIGASMGAMTLAGYVQGAHVVATEGSVRVAGDAATAAQRQAELLGCVFVEFPARLAWPESLYDEHDRLRWRAAWRHWRRCDGDVNYPFELMARQRWLHTLLDAAGHVPVHWCVPSQQGRPWYGAFPAPLARGIEHLERSAVAAMLRMAGTFTGATNHRAEVMLRGRRYVFDQMKAGVLRQLTKCVRQRAFVSDTGTPDYVYSDHYDVVALPTLVVQGARDRIANAGITRSDFFDRIAARDKVFLLFEEIAHGELEAAPIASAKAYPAIRAWLDARRSD